MLEAFLFIVLIGCLIYALPAVLASGLMFCAMVAFIIALIIEAFKGVRRPTRR